MDPSDLATMSQSELAMRMGNDQAMMSGWNKRKSRGKVRISLTEFLHSTFKPNFLLNHAYPFLKNNNYLKIQQFFFT